MAVTVSSTVAATVNGHTVDRDGVNRNRPVNWVAAIAIAATIAAVRTAVAASPAAVRKVIKPIP